MTFICKLDPYSLEIYGMCDMHLVRHGHSPSHDKDGGHTMRSAILENAMLHANIMDLSLLEPKLWATEVYIAGIGIFNLLLLQ